MEKPQSWRNKVQIMRQNTFIYSTFFFFGRCLLRYPAERTSAYGAVPIVRRGQIVYVFCEQQ